MIANSILRILLDSADRGDPHCAPRILVKSSREPVKVDRCPPASSVHRALVASDDTAWLEGISSGGSKAVNHRNHDRNISAGSGQVPTAPIVPEDL